MPHDKQSSHPLLSAAAIARWSGWDRYPGARPFARAELERLQAGLDQRGLALVRGPRATGKTTLLRQLAGRAAARGWDRRAILFVDLEDPLWAPRPSVAGLEALLAEGTGLKLLLLDGVERLDHWADWARQVWARRRLAVAAAATGPVAGAAPAGMAAVECLPLDLGAWIKEYTDKKVDIESARQRLDDFLRAGGLPVERSAEGRRRSLIEVFFAGLMQDVLLRQQVRDANMLTAMSVYLLTQTGRPVSASRLKGSLTRSVDQARRFLAHLQAAGLIHLVTRLEDRARPNQAARLCFAADTGLAWALRQTPSAKQGDISVDIEMPTRAGLAWTAVLHCALRAGLRPWAWRARNRHGLVIESGRRTDLAIDLQLGRAEPDPRPLGQAMADCGCAAGLLLTDGAGLGDRALAGPGSIAVRHLADWLLDPELTSKTVAKERSSARPARPQSRRLPRHLL